MLPWSLAGWAVPRKHLSCECSFEFEATDACQFLPLWISASRCKIHVEGSALSGESLEKPESEVKAVSISLAPNSTRSITSSSDSALYPR